MDTKTKASAKSKHSAGFLKSIHRLPTKFVKDCGFIPVVLINAASMVERFIKTKEIFQTQGTLSKAYATLNMFRQGKRYGVPRNLSVHDAVEAIKLVLTSLPEPLIPEEVCEALITASRENSTDQYGVILGKFRKKSPLNFGILHYMMILLKKVSQHTHQNLMDVRKLATIFVLDVIKPLKLDDPNDVEFLSDRMQRLPYLIMVVEKLIFNVDIFKTCRSLKPDASTVVVRTALNEFNMPAHGTGSGDSRRRGVGRTDLDKCGSAFLSPKTFPFPKSAGPARLKCSDDLENVVLRAKVLPDTGRKKSDRSPQNLAKSSKSVAIFGRDVRSRLEKTVYPGNFSRHLSPSPTKCESLTTLNSSGFIPTSQGSKSNAFYGSSRSPKTVSKPSYGAPKLVTVKISSPKPTSKGEHKIGITPTATKGQRSVLLSTKNDFPLPSVEGDFTGQSFDKEAEKQQRLGKRIKPKAVSLSPPTRLGTNFERKGSSPKKKGQQIKSKVNSFRATEMRIARPVIKRRCNSVGVVDTRTRLSRFNSLGRRKRKSNLSSRKSRDTSIDKLMLIHDEIMSPWINGGMTSDDNSLMCRTIRNPRILPVPSSPELRLTSPRRDSWDSSFDISRRLKSRNSDHSPTSYLLAASSSASHLLKPHILSNDLACPNSSKQRNVGDNALPRVRLGSPKRTAPTRISVTELSRPMPSVNDVAEPSIKKEEKERFTNKEIKEMSNFVEKDNAVNTNETKDKLAFYAAAGDSGFSNHKVEKSKDESKKKAIIYTDKSPRAKKPSPKKKDKLINNGTTSGHRKADLSKKLASQSTSETISKVSSNPKRAQHKVIPPLHLQRVDLQHLRQFRLHNHGREPQLKSSKRSKKSKHRFKCSHVWLLVAVMFFICLGIAFHYHLRE